MIPHWYISADRILYWDRFGRPALAPDRGVSIETWWIDAAKDAALERRRGQGGS